MRILNVGCGNDTYGTDRIDIVKTKTTTAVADITKRLPYEDNLFDEVYCRSTIEHMPNPFNLVQELVRVAKKGGLIIIITDSARYFGHGEHGGYRDVVSGYFEDRHYMIFQPSHLANHLQKAGCRVVSSGYKKFAEWPMEKESYSSRMETWKGKLLRWLITRVSIRGYPMVYGAGVKL